MSEYTQTTGDVALDEAAKVRYLSAEEMTLFQQENGGIFITIQEERTLLRWSARRCFPMSAESVYISLRDGEDKEVGIIRDLSLLEDKQRKWIEEDLERRYYTPVIQEILHFRQRWGGVEWEANTSRGRRKFITKNVSESISEAVNGLIVINDIDGNRYEADITKLDPKSQAILAKVL